eukprot:2054436-Rhodomonas_salina.1
MHLPKTALHPPDRRVEGRRQTGRRDHSPPVCSLPARMARGPTAATASMLPVVPTCRTIGAIGLPSPTAACHRS